MTILLLLLFQVSRACLNIYIELLEITKRNVDTGLLWPLLDRLSQSTRMNAARVYYIA